MSLIVPFGPQHPVLPEPLQLRLEIVDEQVVSALPVVGYVHRGLERLAEQKDFQQDTYLIERVCGICSFIHSTTYCTGIEEKPAEPKSNYAVSFESLFMQIWRTREHIMDAMEFTTGGRVMLGAACIGGVRKDINPEQAKYVLDQLDLIESEIRGEFRVLLEDYTVKDRMVGVGVLDSKTAYERGAVGPTARASGLKMDHLMTGYAAYGELGFEPVVETAGDAYARTQIRIGEVKQSIELVRRALAQLPDSELKTPFKGNPLGEVAVRAEQPRGEVLYYLKGNGTDRLERLRIRTPTFANIAPMLTMLTGCNLANVGVIVLSVDPCISCTER